MCYVPAVHPILLLLDCHSSHYNTSVIESATEEGVIIFCLPLNTTHRTQLHDKGFSGAKRPTEIIFEGGMSNYLSKYKGKAVTHFQFSEVISRACVHGITMDNVIARF